MAYSTTKRILRTVLYIGLRSVSVVAGELAYSIIYVASGRKFYLPFRQNLLYPHFFIRQDLQRLVLSIRLIASIGKMV